MKTCNYLVNYNIAIRYRWLLFAEGELFKIGLNDSLVHTRNYTKDGEAYINMLKAANVSAIERIEDTHPCVKARTCKKVRCKFIYSNFRKHFNR